MSPCRLPNLPNLGEHSSGTSRCRGTQRGWRSSGGHLQWGGAGQGAGHTSLVTQHCRDVCTLVGSGRSARFVNCTHNLTGLLIQ